MAIPISSGRSVRDGESVEEAARRRADRAREQAGHDVELFARWAKEDATDDSHELIRRDEEHEVLRRGLDENRRASGERLHFDPVGPDATGAR